MMPRFELTNLQYESPPITTRPGIPPINLDFVKWNLWLIYRNLGIGTLQSHVTASLLKIYTFFILLNGRVVVSG